jgi:hypothetical protein
MLTPVLPLFRERDVVTERGSDTPFFMSCRRVRSLAHMERGELRYLLSNQFTVRNKWRTVPSGSTE